MALYEHDINVLIASLLADRATNWSITPQATRVIRESPGKAFDILIEQPGRQPIVVENKFEPDNADQDAQSRLGSIVDASGRTIRAAIALQTPVALKYADSIQNAQSDLPQSVFHYCLYQANPDNCKIQRYPNSGYVNGDLVDLAMFIDAAGFPTEALDKSIEVLEKGVMEAVTVLKELANYTPEFKVELAEMFTQSFRDDRVEQVLGIGCTILINALVFQQRLAGLHGIRSLSRMKSQNALHQAGILAEWERILQINYWSVFSLATSFLKIVLVPTYAHELLSVVARTAEELTELGASESHDIAGVVFQRFITDRKYLATYYTRPESATLLAQLAIRRNDVNDSDKYRKFRIADYACGTGTLMHAAYHRLARLYEFTGGSPAKHHGYKMSETLTAFDVVPSAAHLTASMLSGVFPRETYTKTRVTIPAYGTSIDPTKVFLGSLELLAAESYLFSTFDISESTAIHARSEEKEPYALNVESGTENLVIMNPPFTRAMSDWIKGDEGTYKPFNALGNAPEVQVRMKAREKLLTQNTCYNGYQSMPSAFCAIAHKMVREGGQIALVLPLTCCAGVSWHKFRNLLATEYQNVVIVSITAKSDGSTSWSANTSISEVLVSATRRTIGTESPMNAQLGLFVNLHRRPTSSMVAIEVGRKIRQLREQTTSVRTMEDGVTGVYPLSLGDDVLGEAIFSNLERHSWPAVGIQRLVLGQIVEQLSTGVLTTLEQLNHQLEIEPLRTFTTVGPAANNIANNQTAAFDRFATSNPSVFPMLWRCESHSQRSLITKPDTEGAIRPGRDRSANSIWDTRSYLHIASEAGFKTHRVIAVLTPRRCIGGRSWPSVQLPDIRQEKALCLWFNTSLGILLYWYFSSKQQRTRGIMTVRALANFPALNVSKFSSLQLDAADALFESMSDLEFDRVNNLMNDQVRTQLDEEFLGRIVGIPSEAIDQLQQLRSLWGEEELTTKSSVPSNN